MFDLLFSTMISLLYFSLVFKSYFTWPQLFSKFIFDVLSVAVFVINDRLVKNKTKNKQKSRFVLK